MKNFMVILFILSIVSNVFAGDRFVRDNDKEIVIDTATHLMWQDNEDAKTIKKTWQEAVDYCENLTLGGYDDWYLPNYNQLWGLADRSRYNPTISDVFQNVASGYYFSSTTDAGYTSYAWLVGFYCGDDGWDDKSDACYVRCVRDIRF